MKSATLNNLPDDSLGLSFLIKIQGNFVLSSSTNKNGLITFPGFITNHHRRCLFIYFIFLCVFIYSIALLHTQDYDSYFAIWN